MIVEAERRDDTDAEDSSTSSGKGCTGEKKGCNQAYKTVGMLRTGRARGGRHVAR